MSDLYSGKYAPPPVKVVGYWREKYETELMVKLIAEAVIADRKAVRNYGIIVDPSKITEVKS